MGVLADEIEKVIVMMCPQCQQPMWKVEDDKQGLMWDCRNCGLRCKMWSLKPYTVHGRAKQ